MAWGEKLDKTFVDGNNRLRVKYHKQIALNELDLMHQAMDEGDLKKAKHHKIIASEAIDEMISARDG